MDNVIYLNKDEVYFYAGFMDENLKVPNIQTWVYLGLDHEDGHIFESTCGNKEQYSFADGISSNIFDHKALSDWLPGSVNTNPIHPAGAVFAPSKAE